MKLTSDLLSLIRYSCMVPHGPEGQQHAENLAALISK